MIKWMIKYERMHHYPGRKPVKEMASMHCQVSEDCMVLVVTACQHGSLVWLDSECNQMKEDHRQSCNQSHLALTTDT